MKKTLTHLPKNKKAELEKITNIIRELCNDVEMIILFRQHRPQFDLPAARQKGEQAAETGREYLHKED